MQLSSICAIHDVHNSSLTNYNFTCKLHLLLNAYGIYVECLGLERLYTLNLSCTFLLQTSCLTNLVLLMLYSGNVHL